MIDFSQLMQTFSEISPEEWWNKVNEVFFLLISANDCMMHGLALYKPEVQDTISHYQYYGKWVRWKHGEF